MVKTTETYIIACTITTDNPLATLCEIMLVFNDYLAIIATASACKIQKFTSFLTRKSGILTVLEPFLCSSLEFV